MKEVPTDHYASIDELRVGMFIHLKGGWLAHPFPLSNFRISSAQQIATLRSLGLSHIRWSPAKSDLEHSTAGFAPSASSALAEGPGPAAQASADAAGPTTEPGLEGERAETGAQRSRRIALAAQRESLQQCQRQFAEAACACKTLVECVPAKPQLAREQSESLARAFADKMLGGGETCIRLLGEVAGDRASTHAINVAVIAMLLGKAFNLSEADLLDLGVGAVLHDIGKLDVPERLRHRDEHLSASEGLIYQEHVAFGVAHAQRMGLRDGARRIIEQHHELADGSGFPRRLSSDRMSVGSRIVALVDRYDNLCNPNVASRALTPHEALSLLFAQSRSKFDASILSGFIRMMGVYPPGSAVQLTDDRYALVVGVNSSRPLKPRVLVHDRTVAADEALLINLEAEPGLGIRRSVKPNALPRDALDYLSPRPRMTYFFEPAREPELLEAVG